MDALKQHGIPGRVTAIEGGGGLPALRIETDTSTAEIYPHGAHLTHFQKKGGEPLLFMSGSSSFDPKKPIRGGVPVIFPWFGPRDGLPMHGFARTTRWQLAKSEVLDNGAVSLLFELPRLGDFDAGYRITVGETLGLELGVVNSSTRQDFTFEACLHTYFLTGGIDGLSVHGLENSGFFDKVTGQPMARAGQPVRITGETDRIYQDAGPELEIRDPGFGRAIRIRKTGSKSTVVWNPWIDKSKAMADFGDDEYQRMICVESGNVGTDAVTLAPGASASLGVEYDTAPI